MSDNPKGTKKTAKTSFLENSSFKLFAVISLAFFNALLFRRSAGILAMIPFNLLFCTASAFIKLGRGRKCLIFAFMTAILNSIEQPDMKLTLTYSALCLLVCWCINTAFSAFSESKRKSILTASLGSLIFVILSVVFVGNPVKAIMVNGDIKDYIESNYNSDFNSFLGEFEFSSIYYNPQTNSYSVSAKSSKFPTETATITSRGGQVTDKFKSLMENKVTESYIAEITTILRSARPKDNFAVSAINIAELPDESFLSAKEKSLYGDISYEITLGGIQTFGSMKLRVEKYMDIISDSGFEYANITFKGGSGAWYRRTVTINRNHLDGFDNYSFQRVDSGTLYRHDSYVSKLISAVTDAENYVNRIYRESRKMCVEHQDIKCFCK